jgi:predicted CXXCH cytochrome family protein
LQQGRIRGVGKNRFKRKQMQNKMIRNNKILATTIILILLSSPVTLAGTIVGSPHDFRGYIWERSGEICTPCHAPHTTKRLPAPLWNHELSTQTYVMYATIRSPTPGEAVGSQPDGMSKICLSCHDGIVAADVYAGNTRSSAHFFGKDLIGSVPTNSHPISFIYDTALAAKEGDLYDPSTKPSGLTGSTRTINADMLFLKRLECSSCHDVHNTKAVPGTKLLVKDNAGSALCLTCHNK